MVEITGRKGYRHPKFHLDRGDNHWCQLKKKDLIFKKEERRLQRGKKAKSRIK